MRELFSLQSMIIVRRGTIQSTFSTGYREILVRVSLGLRKEGGGKWDGAIAIATIVAAVAYSFTPNGLLPVVGGTCTYLGH